MGGFLPDFLQNTSNVLANLGIATPELGWTEATGGSNVAPNHNQDPSLNFVNQVMPGPNKTTGANSGGTLDNSGSVLGASTGSSANAQTLAQYDAAISQYQNSLDRLQNQLGIAQGNIGTNYTTSLNELNSALTAAQGQNNQQTTQNQQNLRTNKNTIADQASQGLRGLLSILGSYGAGGSSDVQNAGMAVADQASQQRAGAGQTFAQNQQAIDTNWGNYQNQDQNQRKKLEDWKTQQLNAAQAQSDSTKQDLLGKLADLKGSRLAAAGGSYTAGAQPYLDQANALSANIDALGRLNPTYTGETPVYTPQSLNSYITQGAGTSTAPSGATGLDSPYLAMLLGNKLDKKIGF